MREIEDIQHYNNDIDDYVDELEDYLMQMENLREDSKLAVLIGRIRMSTELIDYVCKTTK